MRQHVEEGDDREQAQPDRQVAEHEHDEAQPDRHRHGDARVDAGHQPERDRDRGECQLPEPVREVEARRHARAGGYAGGAALDAARLRLRSEGVLVGV